eukprot:scaffold35366_cov82-Attheya_sp.AAC.1
MGKPLTIDGYCTVKPEFSCDETGSKYLGWCRRSAPLGGAPLTYLVNSSTEPMLLRAGSKYRYRRSLDVLNRDTGGTWSTIANAG